MAFLYGVYGFVAIARRLFIPSNRNALFRRVQILGIRISRWMLLVGSGAWRF